MNKTTQELLEILKHSPSITSYLEQETDNLALAPLHKLLNEKLAEKNISTGDVIKRSGLDRVYVYQILAGKKAPSRDKVLALCLAIPLSLEETMDLLKRSGYPPLYPRIERDSVLIFSIQRQVSVMDANELLYELGLDVLE